MKLGTNIRHVSDHCRKDFQGPGPCGQTSRSQKLLRVGIQIDGSRSKKRLVFILLSVSVFQVSK